MLEDMEVGADVVLQCRELKPIECEGTNVEVFSVGKQFATEHCSRACSHKHVHKDSMSSRKNTTHLLHVFRLSCIIPMVCNVSRIPLNGSTVWHSLTLTFLVASSCCRPLSTGQSQQPTWRKPRRQCQSARSGGLAPWQIGLLVHHRRLPL